MSYETFWLKKCDNLKPKRHWVKEIFQTILEYFYSQMPEIIDIVFDTFRHSSDSKLAFISYEIIYFTRIYCL